MTVTDLGDILRDCGVAEERITAFQDNCTERFGAGVLNPANLVDAGRFELKTSLATLSVDPEFTYAVETRCIDGKNYILFPAEDGMELNGFSVSMVKPEAELDEAPETEPEEQVEE
jgi:hypothetical protein